ncbi:FecR family protein [Pedobacter heparinus]|uniref:FecR protein n=1 Tax=Pedobacter heparinus (strain ATCC 13125 / DSM 2366 / CIP 104194 / JCM 7457 / NBRC 12017 / NCIMB 9290 / NRRL B-14731 / HIM 762-3) TaxID=485917 RepID=C6XYS7_PEDHD|nr:FecR domain-containing protein [Pedobacter heparinus]ACU04559.1 FecR protein [Pedobacter heparinus DSM 2366]
MEDQKEKPTLLFQKFLEGKCNAIELQVLLDHFNVHDINEGLKDLVSKELLSNEITDQLIQMKVDRIIHETDKEIRGIKNRDQKLPKIAKIDLSNWKWLSTIAAAVLIITFGILNFSQILPIKGQLAHTEVPNSKVISVILADGSKITLNAGSKLSYPKQFKGRTREVFLEGEAMFEVARDIKKPFIVHSGNLRTTVLGTSFNIKAYKGDERIQVTVISGKVNVVETATGRNVNLVPDERVVFNAKTAGFDLQRIPSAENATKWKNGRLSFDDTRFDEVVQEFTRKYGLEVVLENSAIANCRVTMVFNQEHPDEILKILAALANAGYKKEGGKIIFYGTGCPDENN